MLISVAHAMGSAGTGLAANDTLMQFAPLVLMLVIFYFLLIRPQQKRAKTHRAMLDALQKGDKVLTTGGLVGRVLEVNGDELLIDLGETKVTISRGYVVTVMNKSE